MEKINIAELLRDCPKGMELDCPMYDNLSYDYIDKEQNRIYCKVDLRDTVWFTIYGCVNLSPSAKCVIFPKGKTTWEGFVFPCNFKNGDIMFKDNFIAIVSHIESDGRIWYHCWYHTILKYCKFKNDYGIGNINDYDGIRHATEEEKAKLFQIIKDNGYKWNEETKTLEKLIEPKFKVGDRIQWYGTHINYPIRVVKSLEWDRYRLDNGSYIKFGDEHAYKLLKFDITTLKPFESKVLIRDYDDKIWIPSFWGKLLEDDSNCRYLTTNGCYKYCIPYEGNEHLVGTTKDCDEYYKVWE